MPCTADLGVPGSSELVAAWIDNVRAEYVEMPGLTLTKPQMRRLWLFDVHTCDALVAVLVGSGFLYERTDHAYARTAHRV